MTGPRRVVHHETVMGTGFTIDIRNTLATSAVEGAVEGVVAEVVRWLHWVDETFSPFRPDSEVARFDRGELSADACSPGLRQVIALCHRFNQVTEGYFDAWATGRFDPCGVVKGWSIDRASTMLARGGFPDHLVDGGGDIALSGSPGTGGKWSVGVKHPGAAGAFCAVLESGPGAVATSGTYERGHHVLDPLRRAPARYWASVTVVGPSLVEADAYATAALAMGKGAPRWLAALDGYESLAISTDGTGWSTAGFRSMCLDPG